MTNEERSPKADGRTVRAARNALAKKQISRESYAAVLRDELPLAEAKAYGRDRGPSEATPPQPVSRISKDDRTPTETPCLCGCGELVPRRFKMGHDMVMFRVAREHLTQGRELTDEQREYLEESGKMRRVKDRLEAEDRKRREREAKKAEKQRDE